MNEPKRPTPAGPATTVGMFASLRYRKARDRVVEAVLLSCGLVAVFITLAIVAILVSESAVFFEHVSLKEFLTDPLWTPLFADAHYGIMPLVAGTLTTTFVALAVAIPFGTTIAIYLSEFAPHKVRESLKPILELLGAVPTVVYGYFALLMVTPALQWFMPDLPGFNMLGPGLVIGVMIIPYVSSVAEDAMRSVPQNLREASYGLGARRITTSLKVVFPAAISGIIAALILATSRAIGETMIVAVAAGAPQARTINPLDPGGTMTSAMVGLATGSDQVTGNSAAFQSLFFVGLLLFLITLVLNVVGDAFVRRARQRY